MTFDITVTDMFCGAGGSTTGATLAGADVRLAINHWQRAIETHNTNYPSVTHALTDLHTASPKRFPQTTILIASPECTSHSLAKGRKRKEQGVGLWDTGKPDVAAEAEERSRCMMWTPLDWAEYHDYQAVILENVVDAHLWRPFQSWLHAWRSLDYDFELVYLNSMHAHPTPQSRDRMYFVAWKRGNRKPNVNITPSAYCQKCERNVDAIQCWKNPNRRYGKYRQQYIYACPTCASEITPYYYAAMNAIDWSIPAPRIGDRARPLRAKTIQRIEYGLKKFAGNPLSIPMTRVQDRLRDITREPLPTQTAMETQGLVMPFTIQINKSTDRLRSLHSDVFPTQTGDNGLAMVLPFITELHGTSKARSIMEAIATVCAGGQHHGLVVPPFLLDHLGEYRQHAITGPFSTICATGNHHSIVTPPVWLMSYYHNGQFVPATQPVPTVTTLDRCALITGTTIAVEECGFRMLAPKEIQSAMAFPPEYVITGTRREQIKQLGNAVTPPVMKLLVERVIASLS